MSCCLGLYRIKAMSERNVALKFACVLLVSGKLHYFHGKHEVITITSPRQAVKFRVWSETTMANWNQNWSVSVQQEEIHVQMISQHLHLHVPM